MTNNEVIIFFEKEFINSFSFNTELEIKNSINIE